MNSITILDENDKSELNQSIDTRSPKKHTHPANDIEGVFTVASGGTGVGFLEANKVLYASADLIIGQMDIPTEESVLVQDYDSTLVWLSSDNIVETTKSIITLNGYSGTTYTVTNYGDEKYTGTIGSSESAKVKVNGFGVYTVSYTYMGEEETKTIDVNAIGLYTVDCYAALFNTASYSEISTAAKNGSASSLWSLGDAKAVKLNGTVGAYNFSNETVYMFIVAFDHNSSVEMNNKHHIICSFAKSALTGGKDIAFTDTKYNKYTSDPCFHMSTSGPNTGGWRDSYMRKTICSQFKNAMPSDLQGALRSRTIYTDNTGGGSGNNSSYVTTTSDYVYIPSEFEVQGSRSSANSYEQNHQQQLAYYKNGASKIRYKSEDTSTAAWWWVRSPHYNLAGYFCAVNTGGSPGIGGARSAIGFAPLITI